MGARSLCFVLIPLLNTALFAGGEQPQPITPKDVVKLFNGKDMSGLYTWLKGDKREDPHRVFTVHDGMIHITGQTNGYIATDMEYRDYHLVVEYKWGEKTYGSKTVRNSGVLLHATGPDGNFDPWMASIECQLAQGCVGDLIVLRGKDERGSEIPVAFKSETAIGPDKRPRWKKGGEERIFTKGQLWWSLHDPAFKELIDTRGKDDVESPLGEWTRVEAICEGDRITVRVNDKAINECYAVNPAAGKILLQSEGFEIYFRRFELHTLKKAEKKPQQKPLNNGRQ
ncbi:MAG: DUF1080 domain-containing protein [Gemmataceae bacterium]